MMNTNSLANDIAIVCLSPSGWFMSDMVMLNTYPGNTQKQTWKILIFPFPSELFPRKNGNKFCQWLEIDFFLLEGIVYSEKDGLTLAPVFTDWKKILHVTNYHSCKSEQSYIINHFKSVCYRALSIQTMAYTLLCNK